MKKTINFVTQNQKVIDLLTDNKFKNYHIPGGQLGFGSQRQLIEIVIQYMLDKELLIKRKETE